MRKGTLEVTFFVRSSVRPWANFANVNFFGKLQLWCLIWPPMVPKWTGSGPELPSILPSVRPSFYLSVRPEVDWKCLSVRPTQTFPLPPWWTLCVGTTSAGHLRPAIFIVYNRKVVRFEVNVYHFFFVKQDDQFSHRPLKMVTKKIMSSQNKPELFVLGLRQIFYLAKCWIEYRIYN